MRTIDEQDSGDAEETRRHLAQAFARHLSVVAVDRYGAERANTIRVGIDETSVQMADVALFELDSDERPEFFFNRPY